MHTDDPLSDRRRRCHTACDSCRVAHVRCNGARPCPMCVQQDRSCTYQRANAGRVSEQQPSSELLLPRATEVEEELDPLIFPEAMDSQNTDLDPLLLNDTFWPFSTSWQWQHEDQYLQDTSPMLDIDGGDVLLSDSNALETTAPSLAQPASSSVANVFNSGLAVESEIATPPSLRAVVDAMVESTLKAHDQPSLAVHSDHISKYMSNEPSFTLQENQAGGTALFERFCEQYFAHFHPLWAMIPRDPNIQTNSHPLLYLTLTSIGALYSGTNAAATYGSILHKKLREVLVHRPFPLQQTESEALDIGRAMLLTQVAALYFEQEGAFSVAQRLAATLSTHAHRMRLFTTRKRNSFASQIMNQDSSREVLLAEGRKMLAFGMVRAETFMSVLFNRKPIISYEEVNLALPCTRDLTDVLTERHAAFSRSSSPPCGGMYFSDLVRITLEDDEVVPVLRPADAEILLFGLQHEIWRFSHDPNVFYRLIKNRRPIQHHEHKEAGADHNVDHLDYSSRKMKALASDYRRTLRALGKWKHAMSQSQISHVQDHHSRSACLSGLILHDLSFLRLFAPLESIQQTAYQLHEPSASDQEVIDEIYSWALTEEAHEAVKYSCSIWHMLRRETLRPTKAQAKYNILALIALHHAAVIIWTIAGTNAHPNEYLADIVEPQASSHTSNDVAMCRMNTRTLMVRFADIYPAITAAWGMQSSFSKMVLRLADQPFPLRKDRT